MVVYYLIMRGINLNSFLVLPVLFVLTIKAITIAIKYNLDSFVTKINLFLAYSLLTGVFYIFNDVPFSCYTSAIRSFVFPLFFAYLGYKYSMNQEFNKWYLYACAFCFLVGFYLYLEAPSYYVTYMADARNNAFNASSYIDESNIMDYARFSSFFTTSYAISCLSVPALILSLSFSLQSKKTNSRILYYFIAFVSFVAAILCQQRIAMACAALVVIFWGWFSKKISNAKGAFSTIFAYIVFISISLYLFGAIMHMEWYDRVSNLISLRLNEMSLSDAMASRLDQYSSFDRMTGFSVVFGLGLGSCGHAAAAVGLKSVADGEFVKLFYEFGFVGCALLAILIIPSLIRGLKYFRSYYAEVMIIMFYLIAGIGSDSFSFFIFSVMMWYSLGRIWNHNLEGTESRI